MYLSRLCLYKYDEVGDGGGDHGCQGAPLHREEVVAGEGAGVPHPGYGVLGRHHLSTVTTVNNSDVTVQQLIHSWAGMRQLFSFATTTTLQHVRASVTKKISENC